MNSESKERTDSDNPSEFLMVAKTWNNYHKIMKRSEHVIINEVSLCLVASISHFNWHFFKYCDIYTSIMYDKNTNQVSKQTKEMQK